MIRWRLPDNSEPSTTRLWSARARIERGLEAGPLFAAGRSFGLIFRPLLSRIRRQRWSHLVSSGTKSVIVKRGVRYALATDDQFISRSIFVNGVADYYKFQTALRILGISQVRHLIDVGANIGEISLSALCRSQAKKATAIEADDRNFELLTTNSRLNGLMDERVLKLIHAAAGSGEPSRVYIKRSDENPGDHQVRIPNFGSQSDTNGGVPNLRLDDLFPSLTNLDYLIWVDVQGYEVQVLDGARNLLRTRVPLVVEFSPTHLQIHGTFDHLLSRVKHYSGYFDLGLHSPTLQDWDQLHQRYEQLSICKKLTDILFV